MVNLLDEVSLDNVGFCLDLGHVNLSQSTEQILEALQRKGYSGVLLYEVSKKKEFVSVKRMKASLLKMRPLCKEKIESGNDKVKKGSL